MSDIQKSDRVLGIATADNLRDIAGPGYPCLVDGRRGRVRRGVFYRSNALRLDDDEITALVALGLQAVLDLRTDGEIEALPDPQIPGTTWLQYDVLGTSMDSIWSFTTPDEAHAAMCRIYAGFIDDPSSRAAFGALFRQLATGGPQLFHCRAGKDRTGWTAALLLWIAGVDEATIMSDYRLTDERTAASRAALMDKMIAKSGTEYAATLEPTLITDPAYLQTAWDGVAKKYGDPASYLRDGLGLGDETIGQLRELLVEFDADQ